MSISGFLVFFGNIVARVVSVAHSMICSQDVFVDGFAFRLVLFSDREPALRKKLLGEAALVGQPPASNVALRQWHHGAMALVAGEHSAFPATAR
jgi:hypothetical protein